MDFIEILKAILFGIVEGITEWLPISSTGHMILLDEFVKLDVSEDFWSLFLVVIQLGAILAVPILFLDKLNPSSKKKSEQEKKNTFSLWGKVIVGAVPAAIFGVLLDDLLDKYLSSYVVVAITLILYGIAFIVVEKINKNRVFR
ncbi:MAG: undecaprenyl-diphosphate phosphatase, partial [Clostridia bacterium]|nr:undecaprenyl-diphosphate phosphatase [Clostridia bacterium]